MTAAVELEPHLTIFITNHDDRLAADFLEPEIAEVRNLPDVTDIDPSAMEDLIEFVCQDIGIGVQAGMDAVAFDQSAIIDSSPGHCSRPQSGKGFRLSL